MPDVTLTTLQSLKQSGEKIAMLTCYDATFAQVASQAGVEVLLVGDSLGMVLQGHDSTLPVSVADMAYHVACVKRGNRGALILADLPFMAYATTEQALHNCAALMQAGAHMIKLEGAGWLAEPIRLLAERGIPVCAHLGLTPQSVHALGGYRIQGRDEAGAATLRKHASELAQAGAVMTVLELMPSAVARQVQEENPGMMVIGIGAGSGTAGQVLVLHDMLNITRGKLPRFVRNFAAEGGSADDAIRRYVAAVKDGSFPDEALHAY